MNFNYRRVFLTSASMFLLGLLLLASLLAYFAELTPLMTIHWSLRDVGLGLAAAAGMFIVFGAITSVRDQAEKILGGALAECHWYDLLILAALVGVTEELLFRGVLEQWVARIHPVFALIAVNIVFGLLHAVSVGYAIVATTLGILLSLLAYGPGEYNLLRPIVAHAAYDFAGFIWLAHRYRKAHLDDLSNHDEQELTEEDHNAESI